MRSFLRTVLALALLIGGWGLDWVPIAGSTPAPHHCCHCGMLPGPHESCPCQKPEGPQGPSQNGCGGSRSTPISGPLAFLEAAGQGETLGSEPLPWPPGRIGTPDSCEAESGAGATTGHGRDPDLGRHLARLRLLRI